MQPDVKEVMPVEDVALRSTLRLRLLLVLGAGGRRRDVLLAEICAVESELLIVDLSVLITLLVGCKRVHRRKWWDLENRRRHLYDCRANIAVENRVRISLAEFGPPKLILNYC